MTHFAPFWSWTRLPKVVQNDWFLCEYAKITILVIFDPARPEKGQSSSQIDFPAKNSKKSLKFDHRIQPNREKMTDVTAGLRPGAYLVILKMVQAQFLKPGKWADPSRVSA